MSPAPPTRAKSMGYIGASFSLGFMVGPAIGGLLAGTDVETANFTVPALTAAGLTVVALGCLLALLPESLTAEQRSDATSADALPIREQLRSRVRESRVRDAVAHRVPAVRRVVVAVVDLRAVDEPRARTRAARHRPDLHVHGIHRRGLSARADRAADPVARRGEVADDQRRRDGCGPVVDGGCDDADRTHWSR